MVEKFTFRFRMPVFLRSRLAERRLSLVPKSDAESQGLCRSDPSGRFINFESSATGVQAFECVLMSASCRDCGWASRFWSSWSSSSPFVFL